MLLALPSNCALSGPCLTPTVVTDAYGISLPTGLLALTLAPLIPILKPAARLLLLKFKSIVLLLKILQGYSSTPPRSQGRSGRPGLSRLFYPCLPLCGHCSAITGLFLPRTIQDDLASGPCTCCSLCLGFSSLRSHSAYSRPPCTCLHLPDPFLHVPVLLDVIQCTAVVRI